MTNRHPVARASTLLLLGVLLSGCAAMKPAPLPQSDLLVGRDLPYVAGSTDPNQRLDVYAAPHQGLAPVVVMIHGGAWTMGSKNMVHYVKVAERLARAGYVVFNINHRLAPRVKVKDEAEDAMAAVIFAKLHAGEYGGDAERIAIVGGSSGGNLSALVAYASDDPWFVPTGAADAGVDSDVDAAVLYYPVMDIDRTLREVGSVLAPVGKVLLVGRTGQPYRDQLRHLSPINHLDRKAVPTLFLTGDKDSLKLYPQSVAGQARLAELGVEAGLYTAPGQDHAFIEKDSPETEESIRLMIEFLDKHLK